jgi:hypothetical protein
VVRERVHELEHELEEAAIEAELETGRREISVEQAQRHVAWRMVRVSIGIVITAFGILLLALPGPGLIVVALGLGVLAQDVPFARRLLDRVQDRIPRDDDGNIPLGPKIALVGSVVIAVVLSGVSIWWSFFR